MKKIFLLLIVFGLLVACNSPTPFSTLTVTTEPTNTVPVQLSTLQVTHTPVFLTQTQPLPTEKAILLSPTDTPHPVCIDLIYGEYAQFEINDLVDHRVLIDVHDPEKLSRPVKPSDILLTTHTHWDHWNENFQITFPGQQLFVQAGEIEIPGVIIKGLPSAHNAGDRFKPEGGTNYIYLIEIGGMRLAHFGDIGQDSLTEEQLERLGNIDIAFSQINNPYSEMNAENRKGIQLMEQVKPKLVILTHLNLDSTKAALSIWPGFFIQDESATVCASDLNQQTQFLIMGEAVETMMQSVDLSEWGAQ